MATRSDVFEKEDEKSTRTSKKVLFVRNLSYDTKDEEFEKAFSDIGPLRRSYLIKEKGSNKCRGFGYVTFAIEEDAQKAMDTVKTLGGRQLKIAFSDKKPRQSTRGHNKNKKFHGSDNENDDDDDDGDDGEHENNNDTANKEPKRGSETLDRSEENIESKSLSKPEDLPSPVNKTRKPKSQRAQPTSDAGRVVYLSGLPSTISTKEIYKRCRKIGEIEKTVFPLEGREEPVAALTFKTHKDARTAVAKLNKKVIKGKEVTAVLKSKESHKPSKKSLKKSRLIIRNLSFKCTEAILKEFFLKFGEISEINIPFTMKGRRKKKQGFGFVQFVDVFCAAKAREKMNLKEILGRPIAVDWAIPKDQYEKAGKSSQESDLEKDHDNDDDNGQQEKYDDDDENKDDDDESRALDDQEEGHESDDHDDDDEDDEDDESEDEDEESHMCKKRPSDVKEGLTVFVSNLNYDTTEESLCQLFKRYGDIVYCKLVTDPLTEHSKGTAFIKFKSVDSVEECMAEDDSDGLFLDGYKLRIQLAVTRGKAEQLKRQNKESKKESRDKRNLYLAREGVISPGSEAAKDLSKADLQKRQKAEAEKKVKIRNPNCFVSTTRLCVRNLSLSTTEKQLQKIFSSAGAVLDGKPAIVKKVLIMRSKDRLDGSGKGRSLGFGFVEFASHKEALTALRQTNNNPEIFGPNRRPIVEFSIENSLALKAKQQRMARSAKNREKRSEEGGLVTKTNKQRRVEKVLRRREKHKLKRLNKKNAESNENKNASKDTSGVAQEARPNFIAKKPNSYKNTLKINRKRFSTKTQQKSLNSRDAKPSKPVQKPITPDKIKPAAKNFTGRKSTKRKAADFKEEAEFNAIVQKYKNKLFGDSGSNAKRSRWFE